MYLSAGILMQMKRRLPDDEKHLGLLLHGLVFRQRDGELRPLVFFALYAYPAAMGVDYLQHVVETDAEAPTGFPGIPFVLCSTLKAVEDVFQFALGYADTLIEYLDIYVLIIL